LEVLLMFMFMEVMLAEPFMETVRLGPFIWLLVIYDAVFYIFSIFYF